MLCLSPEPSMLDCAMLMSFGKAVHFPERYSFTALVWSWSKSNFHDILKAKMKQEYFLRSWLSMLLRSGAGSVPVCTPSPLCVQLLCLTCSPDDWQQPQTYYRCLDIDTQPVMVVIQGQQDLIALFSAPLSWFHAGCLPCLPNQHFCHCKTFGLNEY